MQERACGRAQATLREQSRLAGNPQQTGQSIASQLDIEKLLQTVTDAATSLTRRAFGAFFYNRVNEGGEDYLLYTLSGAPREAFEKFGHPRATRFSRPRFAARARCSARHHAGSALRHHGAPPRHAAGAPARAQLPARCR
jgi:hypothetical protein